MDARRIDARRLDPELEVPRDAYDRFRALVRRGAERVAGRYGKDATELVLMVPDVLLLFVGLMRDDRVSPRHKLFAGAVVAYLVSPLDLLPEALLGPLGLADDIVLAFMGLDIMLNRVPHAVLRDHWRGDRDLIEVARLGTRLGAQLVPRALYDKICRWLERAGG